MIEREDLEIAINELSNAIKAEEDQIWIRRYKFCQDFFGGA